MRLTAPGVGKRREVSLIVETVLELVLVPPLKTLLWYSSDLPYDVSCFDDATSTFTPDAHSECRVRLLLSCYILRLRHRRWCRTARYYHKQKVASLEFLEIIFTRSFWFIWLKPALRHI